ncbi:hypothetical protein HYN49_04475 [Flavobacterium pallidum]|uniref:Uncharacterized protein n=1 Tax=Flavobacterium pallidum TaxID=2172098 RepID=A0A2S1SFL6_9FLAO|nr:hypothetical protein HYN49_04475 [Flavobacterium pallidum]
MKKNSDSHQAMNAVNRKTNEVYAFVADKEKIHLLHYNNALFLRDTLSVDFPDKQSLSFIGYAFEGNNPVLLLADTDLKKVQQIVFDLEDKSTSVKTHDFIPKGENFICSFTQDGIFYAITTLQKASNLKFYIFSNGSLLQQTIDFSGFEFADERAETISFSDLLSRFPIEKLETQSVNALASGIQKTKLFIETGKIILTIDTNPKLTSLFQINLNDFSVNKTDFLHPVINPQNPKVSEQSNSYYNSNRLYQLKFNEEKLMLSSTDLSKPDIPQTHEVSINDTITFRHSTLWSRTGKRQPSEISVKKFFRKLDSSQVGMTVYTTMTKNTLITIGGLRETTTAGNLILGVALGAGSIAYGGSGDVVNLFDNDTAQSVYFESVFDEQFRHLDSQPEILADDYISQFLDDNDAIMLTDVFRYKDFYILAYYEKKGKRYVLRKFSDGGVD